MSSGFINAIVAAQDNIEKLYKVQGGLNSELFLHSATIFDVDDPENLSRVRVLFEENDNNAKSDWIHVLNSGKGKISTQYLDSEALVASISGDPDNGIVIGLYNKSTKGGALSAAPIVVPIIDKADISSAEDPGTKCSKDNEGRMYLFSNNVSQDVKICVRRNNRQTGPDKDVWEWKNITRGLIIEKSEDPKQLERSEVLINEKPLPKCSQELEGEFITFSEDRDFRQIPMVCKKDENKEWAWTSASAVPTYFKTTLPKCSEKIHGQQAIIDDGNNSELGICVRMDRSMKWVKYGTRSVIKFADKPEPISKSELLEGALPNPNLALGAIQFASGAANPLAASGIGAAAMKFAGGSVGGIIPDALDSVASIATDNAGVNLAMATGSKILSNQGISIPQLTTALGDVSNSEKLISSLGRDAEKLIREGVTDPAKILSAVGSESLVNGLGGLSAADVGQMTSLFTGGNNGLIDATLQYGLDQVTGPAAEIFSQVVGGLDLANAPSALSSVLTGGANGGLTGIVSDLAGGLDLGGINTGALAGQLLGGDFGSVAGIFQDFSNFGGLNFLGGGLPMSASSLLGAAGLGGPLNLAFPGAGLGLAAASALLGGSNPLSSILGGGGAFGALGGLFGGGGGPSCPCEPVCRKVSHGVDSDGNRLLDPAGNLTLKNSNVYGQDILNNNNSCLAKSQGLNFTGIGKSLIPSNILDFTSVIKSIPRVGEMASSFEQAIKGGAEEDDLKLELNYTFEAIEKTFKMADNNMSIMELIQRLELLGSSDFMNNLIADKDGGLLGKMSADDVEQSLAIKDLYRMIKQLNSVKKGGSANVAPTPAIIATLANPGTIPGYFSKSKARAILNLIKNIIEGLSILGSLDPELGAPFQDLETINTESKVLNDSLSAKISNSQPKEDTANFDFKDYKSGSRSASSGGSNLFPAGANLLSTNQLESGDFDNLLSQIQNEQKRAREGEGDCS